MLSDELGLETGDGATPSAGTPASPPGYQLFDEIGRGGMGIVYRAYDSALNREVAVKILQDKFAPGSPTGHHGGRWAVYQATWISGDASTPVTSWSQLESLVASGQVSLVRTLAADFRCPVLGNPEPIG